ncbi:MAG: tRNA (N6-isopentenyl adenosine(37)-C2)-methylthiotransferase MiaB [bacterium]
MTGRPGVYIETYGCQMNEYDSDLVRSILVESGYELVPDENRAQVILLNTCAVRENAHKRIYGRLQQLKAVRAKRPYPVTLGILGCMAQNLRRELLDTHHDIDFIAGPDSYRRLPGLIARSRESAEKGLALELSRTETYSGVDPIRGAGVNAWLAVMRGCDNMCSFCVVPYTRGRERSRDPEGILAEVESLVRDGFKQVTLLGQNVNSYRHGSTRFADLVERVADVPGIERVRFTAPHPKDFPKPLLDVIAGHPRVCRHIHLPLQAGSNRMLDIMRRTYTIEELKNLVGAIRGRIPGVSISTDVIVGFSGESDAEFEDTYRAMEEIRFDFAFIFKYSERKGTYAARKLPDDVAPAVKTERIVRLVELQKQITGEINQTYVGTTVEVLVEDEPKKYPGMLAGRTETFKNTIFPRGNVRIGDLVRVTVARSRGSGLFGYVAGDAVGDEGNVCAG